MTIFSQLADDGPVPGARVLEQHLRRGIEEGRLAPGERLPPIREAAWKLGCAPGTVARAYRGLVAAGLAHGEVGRGTFIGGDDRKLAFPQARGQARQPDPARDRPFADFSVNGFLMEDAGPLLTRALQQTTAMLAGHSVPLSYRGVEEDGGERQGAIPFLSRWREGLVVDEIVVTAGAQAALSAVFLALQQPGGGIACDALTYPGVIGAAAAIRERLLPLRMDEDGMDPDALDALCRRSPVSCVFLMPAVQNPTGRTMPLRRREQLATVALRHGVPIVEDQVYGFLEEDRVPGFSHLAPDATVLVTGLSKCVAPVLRVGYVAAARPLARKVMAVQNALNLMVSPILTQTAVRVLADPEFEARLDRLRAGLRCRAAHVAEVFADLDRTRIDGGLAWLPVGENWTADGFAAEAEAAGIRVSPARFFSVEQRAAPQSVRLCLASVPDEVAFRTAIAELAALRGTCPPMAGLAP
ncbi:PLP-dependent aminotransferase family protein [Stappia sp.]|uniref:aminotransferase-like domain-containing protein n=1 Tax=Stappia sp. TaxID=1870903 RepID=UPI003D122F3D